MLQRWLGETNPAARQQGSSDGAGDAASDPASSSNGGGALNAWVGLTSVPKGTEGGAEQQQQQQEEQPAEEQQQQQQQQEVQQQGEQQQQEQQPERKAAEGAKGGRCPPLTREVFERVARNNTVMFTLMNTNQRDFGDNWLAGLQDLGVDYVAVGAADAEMSADLAGRGVPCFEYIDDKIPTLGASWQWCWWRAGVAQMWAGAMLRGGPRCAGWHRAGASRLPPPPFPLPTPPTTCARRPQVGRGGLAAHDVAKGVCAERRDRLGVQHCRVRH